MQLRRIGGQRVALILAIVAITCEISWANAQCKTVMMDAHMKRCRLDARARRAAERFDLQWHDEKSMRQEALDHMKDHSEFHGVPRKRQLPLQEFTEIALPIVTKAVEGFGISKIQELSSGFNKENSGLGLIQHAFSFPASLMSIPVADLGIDLNTGELDDDVIHKRLPRASKEEARKVFLQAAFKCCQNVYRCLKEPIHVPCLIT